MGISLITAIEIQGNGDDIKCASGGPSKDSGKYVGRISLWRDGNLHKEMLSTEPVFDSPEEAREHMEGIVKKVRSLNLNI